MGADAPADHIIASIVAMTGAYSLPLVLPFVHRFPRRTLKRAAILPTFLTAIAIAVFAMREPFDVMHPKRIFVLHMENVSELGTRCLTVFVT